MKWLRRKREAAIDVLEQQLKDQKKVLQKKQKDALAHWSSTIDDRTIDGVSIGSESSSDSHTVYLNTFNLGAITIRAEVAGQVTSVPGIQISIPLCPENIGLSDVAPPAPIDIKIPLPAWEALVTQVEANKAMVLSRHLGNI